MIKNYLKRLIVINKGAILMEVLSISGLMQLLMKSRNTDEGWTREEKKEIKRHLKNIAKILPAVAVFSLPGGSFLLPILAEALDRRKTRRLWEKKVRGCGLRFLTSTYRFQIIQPIPFNPQHAQIPWAWCRWAISAHSSGWISPRIPIFIFLRGRCLPEAAIASSTALTNPKQQGTSM